VLGWDHPEVVGGFALAPVALLAFLAIERRVDHPLLPLALPHGGPTSPSPSPRSASPSSRTWAASSSRPLFLDAVFGYTETRIGGLMIARPLTFAIVGPVAGYLAVKVGERTSAVTGRRPSWRRWSRCPPWRRARHDLVIIGALALSGMGLGASSPALAASVANSVDEADLGVAGAFQQMMSQFGVVVGIQVMQTVAASREGRGRPGGGLRRGLPGGGRRRLPGPHLLAVRAVHPPHGAGGGRTRRGRPAGRPRRARSPR
jgi:hypothetical protein